MNNVEYIFDMRRADLYTKKGNNAINSVTYPNYDGANDGDYDTYLWIVEV